MVQLSRLPAVQTVNRPATENQDTEMRSTAAPLPRIEDQRTEFGEPMEGTSSSTYTPRPIRNRKRTVHPGSGMFITIFLKIFSTITCFDLIFYFLFFQ